MEHQLATTKAFAYSIDVIEGCNLRCPSCPVGNFRDAERPKGRMSVEKFDAIMDKIACETPNVQWIGLFSWTEPLLHPELDQIVASVKRHGFRCHLSSNLNRIERLEQVIAAQPDHFRISVSGFSQETYGQTHRGGDIEKVKANMRRLREILNAQNSKTEVFVAWHNYRHNIQHDLHEMQRYATELCYVMEPVWAYLMPLEKIIAYHEGRLPQEDQKVIDLFVLSPKEQKDIQVGTAPCDCVLRSEQFAINADGSVALCCGTFDAQNNIAPSFLDTPHAELQRRKYESSFCDTCMSHEIHKTAIMLHREKIDWAAYRNLGVVPPLQWWLKAAVVGTREASIPIRARLKLGTRYRALKSRLANQSE